MNEALDRYAPIVDDWAAFQAALGRPLPTCVWVNPARTNRARVLARLAESGVQASPLAWHDGAFRIPHGLKPGNHIEFVAGHVQVQEEAALIPVELMPITPGMRVMDLCAAPGNKTAQLAVALGNTGTVVANDRSYQRARAIRNTADRLGLLNIVLTISDAGNIPNSSGPFDAVLADVPCSCEGTSRKNPSALKVAALETVKRMGGTQRAILRKAFKLCRTGGTVMYATCSYAPEENEFVVADVLADLDHEVTWVPARIPGFVSSPGLTTWAGRELGTEMANAMRVWPHHNDTGGFFVAMFKKGAA